MKHAIAPKRDLTNEIAAIRSAVEGLSNDGEKSGDTPPVGHELFKLGALTNKSYRVSPLFQPLITNGVVKQDANEIAYFCFGGIG